MKNKLLLVAVGLFLSFGLSAQKYKVPGAYKGQAGQGMAIFEHNAYILSNTGYCRVYNLQQHKVVREFQLASYGKGNHANCASFGVEHYGGNNVPVLYVSESASPYRCFVENINNAKPELVQTIQVYENDKPKATHDWIVDSKKGFLYTFTRRGLENENGLIRHSIIKYRLPALSEGKNVILTSNDVIDQFELAFLSMGQGGTIKGKYLYLPVGLSKANDGKRNDAERSILVVDLKKKRIKKVIDLSDVITDEPEDVSFDGKELLLFCGQKGGLWSIKK